MFYIEPYVVSNDLR